MPDRIAHSTPAPADEGQATVGQIKAVLREKLDLSDELLADMEDNLTAVAVAVLLSTLKSASTPTPADEGLANLERLQAAWDASDGLPPIEFTQQEADNLLAALTPASTPTASLSTDELVDWKRPFQSESPPGQDVARNPDAPAGLFGAVGIALFRSDCAGMTAPDAIAEIGNAAFAFFETELTTLRQELRLEWRDGPPPKPWSEEWFIARTTYGDRVVLRALPEEYTYDFKTADETYIKADKIAKWMQFPDSHYIAPGQSREQIRAEAFEEAAKVADRIADARRHAQRGNFGNRTCADEAEGASAVAQAIRELGEQGK